MWFGVMSCDDFLMFLSNRLSLLMSLLLLHNRNAMLVISDC